VSVRFVLNGSDHRWEERIVTAAALLISPVFLAFALSGITFMKALGIGLPLAALTDATLIRGALLPAAMRLSGNATWWVPAGAKVIRKWSARDDH
jgi:putative drug exporter of the RND superfamily